VIDGALGLDYSDVFQHTLHYGLDMRSIRHVLITHDHYDHLMRQDILSRAVGMTEPIHFYFSPESGAALANSVRARMEKMAAPGSNYNGNEVLVETHFLEKKQTYDIGGYTVIPLPARHGNEKLGAYIYVIQKDGKSVLWAHDTGKFRSETIAFLKESGIRFDFVSLDCTLKRGEPITGGHMDVERCREMVELLRENGNADDRTRVMLSHIGHLVERTHEELCAEVAPFGFEVAYDGLEIEI
jgi:phosphoribosyl 1,2-cyclic phosphate phosphodiesterase